MSEKIYGGDDYNEMFDFEYYMNMYLEEEYIKEANKFHNEWLTGLGKQGKLGGQTLLEIGTGTILQNVAVMAPYYEQIVLTDYAEKHRNWLHDWWQGKNSVMAKKLIQQVIEVEGTGQSVEEREKETQRKTIAILPSNVHFPNLLRPCSFRMFDTVITKWVFDVAVTNVSEYAKAVANVGNVLRRGSLLVVLEISSKKYAINGTTFKGAFHWGNAKLCQDMRGIPDRASSFNCISIGELPEEIPFYAKSLTRKLTASHWQYEDKKLRYELMFTFVPAYGITIIAVFMMFSHFATE